MKNDCFLEIFYGFCWYRNKTTLETLDAEMATVIRTGVTLQREGVFFLSPYLKIELCYYFKHFSSQEELNLICTLDPERKEESFPTDLCWQVALRLIYPSMAITLISLTLHASFPTDNCRPNLQTLALLKQEDWNVIQWRRAYWFCLL